MAEFDVEGGEGAQESPRRRPALFEIEPEPDGAAAGASTPFDAPQPPDEPGAGAPPAGAAALKVAAGRRSGLASWFWGAALGLLGMALSVAAWDFAATMLARNPVLGAAAAALAVVAAAALALFALREAAAVARLGRVEAAREALASATDRSAAVAAVDRLRRLYAGRADLAWALAELKTRLPDAIDAEAVRELAERALMTPLDAQAQAAVSRSARQVAAATALIPIALVDVLATLAINLAMIRRVAEIYGGRAGWLGSLRLLRAVAGHILATGAVSIGDDMIGPALGGGVASRLSRRFGEGLLNGALCARVGVAAIEVCRPAAFVALPRPSWRGLAGAAIRGLAGEKAR